MTQYVNKQRTNNCKLPSRVESGKDRVTADKPADRILNNMLHKAQEMNLAGDLDGAILLYRKAIRISGRNGFHTRKAQAMRKLGTILRRKGETGRAISYYKRSIPVSQSAGDISGCAKAYNGLGVLYFNSGNWKLVKKYFNLAMEKAEETEDLSLMANIYNNLGAMSNILGDWETAISYYEKSLDYYRNIEDMGGLAKNYNNLGLTYRDMGKWSKAAYYCERCVKIAGEIGDVALGSNCLLNLAHVLIELSRLGEAREKCDIAYESLSDIGEVGGIAEALMIYGMIYTRMRKWALAEKHFQESVMINKKHDNLLGMAECYREMALLYQGWGKNKKALEYLGKSFHEFRELKAIRYLQEIGRKTAELEEMTFKLTRDMGAAVESKDTYTFGHSQRVAHYAVEIAKKMHLKDDVIKGIMVAAYLHDLGKVRVKKKILQKSRKLTVKEFFIIQMHPNWGVELLKDVEFPWDVKPLIRHHQEKWDGSGYPDGLQGEAIPIGARIIAVADMFDALTTDRPYRKALPLRQAVKILKKESGVSLDSDITNKFLRIVRLRFPADFKRSMSSIPVPAFLKLWEGESEGKEKPSGFLRRRADLSSLVRT